MKEVEIHIPTRRRFPKKLVEMFNWQTCKDFTLRIITRYPQPWRVEDLNVDFPVELKLAKLAYSTGTRYGWCLASNEALCSATSKYVLSMIDFTVMSPISIERFLLHADEDLCLCGRMSFQDKTWEDYGLSYDAFKQDMDPRTPKPEFVAYEWRDKFNMLGGCLFFPLKVYRAVNGWDLAFDGSWGVSDHNLGSRVMRAGFKMAVLGGALHFKHVFHYNEKDDPPISSGRWVVNKETGAKIKWEKRGGDYNRWCMENNVIRALQGLEEVCKLLK